MEGAFSKVETEGLVDVVLHFCFEDHIVTSDPEVDVSLSDKRRDVSGREEDPVNVGQYERVIASGSLTTTYSAMLWFKDRQTSRRWRL